jgi:hypothetical protein
LEFTQMSFAFWVFLHSKQIKKVKIRHLISFRTILK